MTKKKQKKIQLARISRSQRKRTPSREIQSGGFILNGLPKIRQIGDLHSFTRRQENSQKLAPLRLSWSTPKQKTICQRRKARREALFASGRAGKIKVKNAIWNSQSLERC